MARGKEKEQPTVVFRDTLAHHEKPEVLGTMYAGAHIQSAPEFSSYSSIMSRMLNARDISMVRTVWRAAAHRRQGAFLYDLVTIKITAQRTRRDINCSRVILSAKILRIVYMFITGYKRCIQITEYDR